jgi:hypothetical protein
MPEPSGGYAVSLDGRFIGRVSRHRSTYDDHSNGRHYRRWSWHASPADPNARSTFHHRTRALATEYLAGHAFTAGSARTHESRRELPRPALSEG